MNIPTDTILAQGTQLANGRYRIVRHISSGGFGHTYLAEVAASGEQVVLKEFFRKEIMHRTADGSTVAVNTQGDTAEYDALRSKFSKEAERLMQLDHPNVVKVYARFDENGTSYYVMPFLCNGSLADRLVANGGPLPEAVVRGVMKQMLAALEYVHGRGLYHLDIKPANILFKEDSTAVLIDFGASKWADYRQGGAHVSTNTVNAFTPGYASLEQMDGSFDHFGPWTDIYSLGATMYNLLTAQRPPKPIELLERGAAAMNMPPAVSPQMQRIVLEMMRPQRTERPQTVAEVRRLFDSFAAMPPVQDGGNGLHAAADATQVGGMTSGAIPPQPPVSAGVPSQPVPKPRSLRWLWMLLGVVGAAVLTVLVLVLIIDAADEQDTTRKEQVDGDGYDNELGITEDSDEPVEAVGKADNEASAEEASSDAQVKAFVAQVTALYRAKLRDEAQLNDASDTYFCNYFIFDIDGDGIEELWIKTGTCEADAKIECYKFRGGALEQIYSGGAGHTGFVGSNRGVVATLMQQGYVIVRLLRYDGSRVVEQVLAEGEDIEPEVNFPTAEIETYALDNLSVLGG